MSSTVPPQSERTPNVSGGDFDSWFWGDAHVRGGVEHAVFQCADSAVVLFDGECNFCNSGVWMMISNSDAGNMRFCAQNSEMGLSLLHSFGQDQERLSSIAVLNKDGHLFTRSSALVEIMSRMHAPYPVLSAVFNAVPESVRDEMYAWVSRRRHAFGTENLSCRIPEEDEVSRFLL